MQDARSSRPNSAKLSNFHIVISSLAAVAGVGLAAYQTFAPQRQAAAPVSVVVSVDPQKADAAVPNETVQKTDQPALKTETLDISKGALVTAALKDGSENRYAFASLFDGEPDTFLAIQPPDTELNMMVTFAGNAPHDVTAVQYIPPEGVDPASMATDLDVTVLSASQSGGAGMQVFNFSLPQSAEPSTFSIPGGVQGTSVNLRVAGKPGTPKVYVGDFKILSEQVAP